MELHCWNNGNMLWMMHECSLKQKHWRGWTTEQSLLFLIGMHYNTLQKYSEKEVLPSHLPLPVFICLTANNSAAIWREERISAGPLCFESDYYFMEWLNVWIVWSKWYLVLGIVSSIALQVKMCHRKTVVTFALNQ